MGDSDRNIYIHSPRRRADHEIRVRKGSATTEKSFDGSNEVQCITAWARILGRGRCGRRAGVSRCQKGKNAGGRDDGIALVFEQRRIVQLGQFQSKVICLPHGETQSTAFAGGRMH